MSARKWGVCQHCGGRFKVCRYNGHHQKFCTRKRCVADRKRLRQRRCYRAQYRSDEAFRESERKRAREGMARRRAAGAGVDDSPPGFGVDPLHVVTAVVSQLTDEKDPVCVMERVRSFAGWGRMLTESCLPRDGPG